MKVVVDVEGAGNAPKKTPIIIIGILIVLLFLQGWYYETYKSVGEIVTKVETKFDTVTINTVEYVPQIVNSIPEPYYIETFTTDTLLITDTVLVKEVFEEHFTKNIYVDTLSLDTLGSIVVTDTISQNKIQSRQFTSNILLPTESITKVVYVNDKGFYVGGGIGISHQLLHSISGEVLYKSKDNLIYGIGLGLGRDNQLLSPLVSGRIYWKIGK